MTLAQDQQDIADAEAALATLGLVPASFGAALQHLVKRRNAQLDMQKIQANQFAPDGFNLINQIQSTPANTDKVVVISQFLRTFAEYITTQTQALEATHPTIKSIVDAISPMGGSS